MLLRPTFLRLHAALVAGLLVALVLAQTLGSLHRVAHPAAGATAEAGWLADLFADHDDDGSCELFDQLTHGDTLCVAHVVPAPSQPPLALPAVHASWHLAAQATGFLARGPPALS